MKCYFRLDKEWIKGQINGRDELVVEKVDPFTVIVRLTKCDYDFGIQDRFTISGFSYQGSVWNMVTVDISPGWRKPKD